MSNGIPMIICSYPRSGSTWLRFILCNLIYPAASKEGHTIDSVNRHIPDIDHLEGLQTAIPHPRFYKSHRLRNGQLIIFLHRHVGDVVISEWWYKKKFFGETRTLEEYLVADDFGKGWREHTDFFFPCARMIGYDDLSNASHILRVLPRDLQGCVYPAVNEAISRSSFGHLQRIEEKGFGIYPTGDPSIKFFRKGTSRQWYDLAPELKTPLLEKNYSQLKILDYL